MLTISGTSWPTFCQSSLSSGTPRCRAIPFRWIGAFVDPPMAELITIVFSKASRVMMSEGRKSDQTISTMRRPVSYAICPRSRYGAGIAAAPGICMPSASASEFIVVAVPMVLQYPTDGADDATSSMNPSASISPAASISRAFHTMVPEPVRSPLYHPFSIGPTDSAIAGILTVAAAIKRAGVVLSHPMFSTTPSSG